VLPSGGVVRTTVACAHAVAGAASDTIRTTAGTHTVHGRPVNGRRAGTMLALPLRMPIYEYKCPNGHLFEVFHGMTEEGPTACEVCGEGPLRRVLHPVAVHYKGSGFYSTDYGRKGRQPAKDGGDSSGSSESSAPKSPADSSGGETKAKTAET
jgi:putative FmdB family regulatory protein